MRPGGEWIVTLVSTLFDYLDNLTIGSGDEAIGIDLAQISRLDTAGAWLLYRTARRLRSQGHDVTFKGGTPDQHDLITQAQNNDSELDVPVKRPLTLSNFLENIGIYVLGGFRGTLKALGFFGLVLTCFGRSALTPTRFRWTAIVHQMQVVGIAALPIVGLISFLIGVVVAYQGADTFRDFGAEIFTVDFVMIIVLRELAILLTAVIIAGRSGSAFTAQIGSMVLHEEVDAMKALALDPIEVLVLPRVIALTVMMPLLTFYADVMGIIGGALVVWADLGITPETFYERATLTITGDMFAVGMIKAPFFGMIIALVGCYEGLLVRGSAESVGSQTTKSVVEAVFLILVLDAFFAVFFTEIGM